MITQGATQSNHARQTAAAAARLGIDVPDHSRGPHRLRARRLPASGNVLLDHLLGASVSDVPGGTDMNAAMAARRSVER